MTPVTADPLVEEYLRRLEIAAATLPPYRRDELVAEIRDHVDEALREENANDEIAVRNVLERLGPPDEIVTAAAGPSVAREPHEAAERVGRLEIAALIALVVPFLGWLVGVVLVVVSRAWTAREKVLGLALLLVPLLLPALGFMSESASDVSVSPVPVEPAEEGLPEAGTGPGTSPAEVALIVMFFLAGLPSAVYLGWRLRRSKDSAARAA